MKIIFNAEQLKYALQRWSLVVCMVLFGGGIGAATLAPAANAAGVCISPSLLTLPAWYRGLEDPANGCNLKSPSAVGGIGPYIAIIGLNVVEFMLQLVGYLCVGFIITGGFRFMTGAGESSEIVAARKTILNAVIGLVISLFSIAIVNVVAGVV